MYLSELRQEQGLTESTEYYHTLPLFKLHSIDCTCTLELQGIC